MRLMIPAGTLTLLLRAVRPSTCLALGLNLVILDWRLLASGANAPTLIRELTLPGQGPFRTHLRNSPTSGEAGFAVVS